MSLLVLCAMPEELKAVAKILKNVTKHDAALYTAQTAKGGEMVLAACGIGAVNAACRVVELARDYEITEVILLGVGGAIVDGMQIADMVVPNRILQHDYCAVFDEGRFFMKPGTFLPSAAMAEHHDPYLYPDQGLREMCLAAVPGAVSGTLITGGEFSCTIERKKALARMAEGANLVEMEAAGVAMAADRLGIPFAVAKTVADRLEPDDGAETIAEDFHIALGRAVAAAAVVARYWQDNY